MYYHRVMSSPLPYVWDYKINEEQFREILAGRLVIGRLNRRWAGTRLFEYAPYREVLRLLGYRGIVEGWPEWRSHVRSASSRRGFDFLVEWLTKNHPELL
jgi:hypothetical protein